MTEQPLLPDELARRLADGSILLRSTPVTIRVALDPADTADGHAVLAEATLTVAVSPTPADRQLLAEELLSAGRDRLGIDDLVRAVTPVLAEAFAHEVAARTADAVLAPGARTDLARALAAAVDRWAFRVGLVVLPPATVAVSSPSVEAQREHERRAREVERLAELTARFARIRGEHPDVPPAALLQQVAPDDRGAILQAALRAGTTHPAAGVLAVSGEAVVELLAHPDPAGSDPDALRPALRIHPTAGAALGPLRSVARADDGLLAVGARDGVMLLDPAADDDGTSARTFPTAAAGAGGRGFSRVIVEPSAGRVLACHGELGVIAWSLATRHELHRWPAEGEVLDLIRLRDGHVVVGERRAARLLVAEAQHKLTSFDADLVALATDEDAPAVACHAILADGSIVTFGPATPTRVVRRPAPGVVTAAAGWRSPIGFRLLRSTGAAALEAIGLDDPVTLHYAAGAHAGCRMVGGAGATLAAVSADRQRVIVWNAWQTARAAGEANLTAATGHRIAGLCA